MWNAWVCQELSEDEIEDLKKTNPNLTILDWTEDLQKTVNDAFSERLSGKAVPDDLYHIDFSNVQFDHDVYFNGFIFPKVTQFQSANFGGLASFKGAEFLAAVTFEDAQFKDANFEHAQFADSIIFVNAYFGEEVNFEDAQFEGFTAFKDAYFEKYVNFT